KVPIAELPARSRALLDEIQRNLYAQALARREAETRQFDDYASFQKQMEGESGGGLADVYWCGAAACETRIREETKATCRAIPLSQQIPLGRCVVCGENASERAFFAKAY